MRRRRRKTETTRSLAGGLAGNVHKTATSRPPCPLTNPKAPIKRPVVGWVDWADANARAEWLASPAWRDDRHPEGGKR
jgi:hypothetical protein